jgi:hypothetical protein
VLAGTTRVAAASELDAVEWVPAGELGDYVPGGLYPFAQEDLDAAVADS